jgi:hypothetical protein
MNKVTCTVCLRDDKNDCNISTLETHFHSNQLFSHLFFHREIFAQQNL